MLAMEISTADPVDHLDPTSPEPTPVEEITAHTVVESTPALTGVKGFLDRRAHRLQAVVNMYEIPSDTAHDSHGAGEPHAPATPVRRSRSQRRQEAKSLEATAAVNAAAQKAERVAAAVDRINARHAASGLREDTPSYKRDTRAAGRRIGRDAKRDYKSGSIDIHQYHHEKHRAAHPYSEITQADTKHLAKVSQDSRAKESELLSYSTKAKKKLERNARFIKRAEQVERFKNQRVDNLEANYAYAEAKAVVAADQAKKNMSANSAYIGAELTVAADRTKKKGQEIYAQAKENAGTNKEYLQAKFDVARDNYRKKKAEREAKKAANLEEVAKLEAMKAAYEAKKAAKTPPTTPKP
jgi:hypothetical protein